MFGFSAEHLIILTIVLLIFGPRKLPELGRTLGKAYRNFKDGIQGVEDASFRKLDGGPHAEISKSESPSKSTAQPETKEKV